MKINTKNPITLLAVTSRAAWVLPALIAALNLISAGPATAQTFTTLHSFTALAIHDNGNFTFSFSNGDGANPYAGLITNSSGTTLYGMAYAGGRSNAGTMFALKTDGTGFTNLHNFVGGPSDGGSPQAGLLLSGTTLYGTAGGVFAANTDGTGFTNVYNVGSRAGLIQLGNTLYGTAYAGGSWGMGAVFAVNTDGTGFTNLHSFTATSGSPPYTNSDGANPLAGLLLSGNTLYGTAPNGGSSGDGVVFAVNTDGTGFTNLHSFPATVAGDAGLFYTNSDGATPSGGLILSGNSLYGTACNGGAAGAGTVFAIHTDGTGFTNLHTFAAAVWIDFGSSFTNSEGGRPQAGLILSGNTLYGTASTGGSSGYGTVFAVKTDGTGFTNLHSFAAGGSIFDFLYGSIHTNSDGALPYAPLILSGNTLYGTAQAGGNWGYGTVFSLSFPPHLTIVPSGPNVILTWPTNVAGFDYTGYHLESTPSLVSPAWTTNSPAPVVIGGQNTVTNPITGAQQFYRLVQRATELIP